MKVKASNVHAVGVPLGLPPNHPRQPQGVQVVAVKARATTEELFWQKVNKNGPTMPHMDTNCWLWEAAKDSDGYGVFAVKRKLMGAHRYGFIVQKGPIPPEAKFIMHRCDNPPCVRGEHLINGTNRSNLADMAAKGRARGGRRTKDGREPKNRRA